MAGEAGVKIRQDYKSKSSEKIEHMTTEYEP
jgi:hypothetical protein